MGSLGLGAVEGQEGAKVETCEHARDSPELKRERENLPLGPLAGWGGEIEREGRGGEGRKGRG